MEKITFPPLIELIKEKAETLNSLIRSANAISGRFNQARIPLWFQEIIQPVFQNLYKFDKSSTEKLFNLLFEDMLNSISGKHQDTEWATTVSSRLLIGLNPAICAQNPAKLFHPIICAFNKISKHSRESAKLWIEIMQQIIPEVKNLNELLFLGRVAAWRCGMAHLRDLIDFSQQIDEKFVSIIFPEDIKTISERWGKNTDQKGISIGAFSGLNGKFLVPPKITSQENMIFVSDGFSTNAIFVDRYGATLQECNSGISDSLKFSLTPLKSAPENSAKILKKYEDLTSWVYQHSTLFLTTASSHSVFVFGGIDG